MEEEAAVALNPASIPAILAARVAAHAGDIVLRKKDHGIWKATTWAELGVHVRQISSGLKAIGFRPGDVVPGTLGRVVPGYQARLVGPENVFAYEANPAPIHTARRNFDRNRLNVELTNAILINRQHYEGAGSRARQGAR